MIKQEFLVATHLAWEPTDELINCLVTWEVFGGGLMGNLLTDSANVELSLWPDTKYRVQVTCARKVSITFISTQYSSPFCLLPLHFLLYRLLCFSLSIRLFVGLNVSLLCNTLSVFAHCLCIVAVFIPQSSVRDHLETVQMKQSLKQ